MIVPLTWVGIVFVVAIALGSYSVYFILEWFIHWWWVIGICSLVRCVLMGKKSGKEFIIADIIKTISVYAILFSNACIIVNESNIGFLDYLITLIFGGVISMGITVWGYSLCFTGRDEYDELKYYLGTVILVVWAIICVAIGFNDIKAFVV